MLEIHGDFLADRQLAAVEQRQTGRRLIGHGGAGGGEGPQNAFLVLLGGSGK